jgi:hypothetical protein
MEYLGNINTSPGSNAGRSIDPTKPGPDDMAMALHDEWNGVGGWASLADSEKKRWRYMAKAALVQSDAEPPGILHNTVGGFKEIVTRDTPTIYDNNPQHRLVEEIFDFDRQLIGFRVYDAADRSGK